MTSRNLLFDIRRYESVSSTMDVCREMARTSASEGIVVLAEEQLAGRGRMGHTWFSPRGQAVYASILLRPVLSLQQSSWLTLLAALAVKDTLDDLAPTHSVTIKWLNDINLNRRKVCGILVETSLTESNLDYAILGIGLNVNTDFASASPDVRNRATSLKQELGKEFDREAILQTLLQHLAHRYNHLQSSRHSPAADYAQHVETLGQSVRAQAGDEIISGIALDVDEWGALQIQTNTGLRSVSFGHIL